LSRKKRCGEKAATDYGGKADLGCHKRGKGTVLGSRSSTNISHEKENISSCGGRKGRDEPFRAEREYKTENLSNIILEETEHLKRRE